MSEQLAEEYIAKAKYTASKTGFFDTLFTTQESIFEEASEYYAKAANYYRLSKMWKLAGHAYVDAATLLTKNKNAMDNIMLQYAVNCYLQLPHNDENFELVKESVLKIAETVDSDFNKIGKLYESLGDYYINDISLLPYYEKALNYYECMGNNASYSRQSCIGKIALLHVNNKNYAEGGKLYEKLVDLCKSRTIISGYQHLRFLTNVFICYLGCNDTVKVNKFILYCENNHLDFMGSIEFKLLYEIADAIETGNIDKYNEKMIRFIASGQTESWKTQVFDNIKNNFATDGFADFDFS